MIPNRDVLESPFLHDLLEQPQALRESVAGFELTPKLREIAGAVRAGKYKRIVLTGMGASLHELHPLNLRLIEAGLTSVMAETSELIHYMPRLLDEGALVVVVSQSGKSAETVRLLEMRGQRGTLIGVTNTADSPLAKDADLALVTRAGSEFSVSCKTYISGLAALSWLAEVLCEGKPGKCAAELQRLDQTVDAYVSQWERHVEALVAALKGVRDLFFAARGSSLATAFTAGLILKESTRYHSEGMSSAAFRHGPIEMVTDTLLAVVYEGDRKTSALNRGLVDDIRKGSGRAYLCGPGADLDPFRLPQLSCEVRPITEILPAQMIALALAALGRFEPGRFHKATKVTEQE